MASYSEMDDTSAEARAVMFKLYRQMSPARKLEIVRQLTLAANQIALSGLRSRYPSESEGALLLRLARLRLGDELVDQVYGLGTGDA
jgi:hypothetical protein